jgi:signal transduction histidine kinase
MRRAPTLQLVVIGPILALLLLAGLALYLLVLRTVTSFADESIRTTLEVLLRNALTITDSEVDRQNRDGRSASPEAALIYQLNARLRLEDFARVQGVGIVITSDGRRDFEAGLDERDAAAVAATPNGDQVTVPSGRSFYVASAVFSPWAWKVDVAKDTAAFDALLRQVRMIYGGSTLALAVAAGLIVLGLRHSVVQPIDAIAKASAAGRDPRYRGVAELEHLSDSIGSTLASLKAKTLQLETALMSMSDAITVFDREMRLVAWNPQFEALYDFPPDLLRPGTAFVDIMRFNAARGDYGTDDTDEQIAEIVERARNLMPPRFEVDRPDGRCFEIRRARMPDGGFVTTYTDITSRRQEERLKAAGEAKSKFLENMSHDLRKPAASIIEEARLLLADPAIGQAGRRDSVETLHANAIHLLGLIDEILEMARIEAGQVDVGEGPVEIAPLVAAARRVIEPAARRKQLAVEDVVPPDLVVLTDGRLVMRILVNLLSNAVEYTTTGGIRVVAGQDGNELRLSVLDSGPGIAADQISLIFEKFHRLDPTIGRTLPGVGLGLGLPISRELARLLGGDILVTSRLGVGSIFTLVIPLRILESTA